MRRAGPADGDKLGERHRGRHRGHRRKHERGHQRHADGTFTRQPDPPVQLGYGAAIHTADPAGGNFIVLQRDDETWWELDPIGQSWSQIMMDAPSLTGSLFHVPLIHCGVILFFRHNNADREVHLYRHG